MDVRRALCGETLRRKDFMKKDPELEKLFALLDGIGNLGPKRENGFDRSSWSSEETQAMLVVKRYAEEKGMTAGWDSVGNLILTTPFPRDRIVVTGSHLDTVPRGGNFDGVAGVLCGIVAICSLRDQWESLRHRLGLVIWRGEESASFAVACKGSQAAFGVLPAGDLSRQYRGNTLEEAIRSQGGDPSAVTQGVPSLPRDFIMSLESLVELHIEQAPLLEIEKKSIGLVTSIRGTIRLRVELTGEANHSGGTPMGTRYRKDANLAMAYMLTRLDQHGSSAREQGFDMVQTVGVINTSQEINAIHTEIRENSLTKVSPYAYFLLDVRSTDSPFLHRYIEEAAGIFSKTAQEYGVGITITRIMEVEPISQLDAGILDSAERICKEENLACQKMPSGSLHDCAIVAQQRRPDGSRIPTGLIFIPCRKGISHNAKEYASQEDLARGTLVLKKTLASLAMGKPDDLRS